MYESLPQHMVCDSGSFDAEAIDLGDAYPKILIRLDHLLNMFLLERLLVKHGLSRSNLLRTSFEMVVLTLHLWTQKHAWASIQDECQWLVGLLLLFLRWASRYVIISELCS